MYVEYRQIRKLFSVNNSGALNKPNWVTQGYWYNLTLHVVLGSKTSLNCHSTIHNIRESAGVSEKTYFVWHTSWVC